VKAIKPDDRLDPDEVIYLQLNRELSQLWPVIYEQRDPLPEAERWATSEGKLAELIR
jgi:ferredoxin